MHHWVGFFLITIEINLNRATALYIKLYYHHRSSPMCQNGLGPIGTVGLHSILRIIGWKPSCQSSNYILLLLLSLFPCFENRQNYIETLLIYVPFDLITKAICRMIRHSCVCAIAYRPPSLQKGTTAIVVPFCVLWCQFMYCGWFNTIESFFICLGFDWSMVSAQWCWLLICLGLLLKLNQTIW